MKKNIAEKWVKALRSGNYNQGYEYLCHKGNYCCLGVLCELYVKDTGDSSFRTEGSDSGWNADYSFFGEEHEILPAQVIDWAGIREENHSGTFVVDKCFYTLSVWNDGSGTDYEANYVDGKEGTFENIADAIEKYYNTI